jgi:hypothetical protein
VDAAVRLVVAVNVEAAQLVTAVDGLFPDGGCHGASVPVDGSWLADAYCHHSTDRPHHPTSHL